MLDQRGKAVKIDSNCNSLKFIRICLHLVGIKPVDQGEAIFVQSFIQDVYFPVPVRDGFITCIVVDLAMSDIIENINYKNVEYQRPQNRALWDSLDYFCP